MTTSNSWVMGSKVYSNMPSKGFVLKNNFKKFFIMSKPPPSLANTSNWWHHLFYRNSSAARVLLFLPQDFPVSPCLRKILFCYPSNMESFYWPAWFPRSGHKSRVVSLDFPVLGNWPSELSTCHKYTQWDPMEMWNWSPIDKHHQSLDMKVMGFLWSRAMGVKSSS